jgi:DNA-binding MarR family transcriptional regulator
MQNGNSVMTGQAFGNFDLAIFAPERTILIIADDAGAIANARTAADAAKMTVSRIVSLRDAPAALAEPACETVVLIELTEVDDVVDLVLDLIEHDRRRAVIAFPTECIDAVVSRVARPVTLLCSPTNIDRAVALASGSDIAPGLNADNDDNDRLQKLADEVARIASTLAELAGSPLSSGGDAFSDGLIGYRAAPIPISTRTVTVNGADVRKMIRMRRLRDRFLSADLFGEAAWDMLLDLMAARIEGTQVAVSSLCIAAAVPPTTALRAIRGMTERGLFLRVSDAHDKRRIFIQLSDATADAMRGYLSAVKQQGAVFA